MLAFSLGAYKWLQKIQNNLNWKKELVEFVKAQNYHCRRLAAKSGIRWKHSNNNDQGRC